MSEHPAGNVSLPFTEPLLALFCSRRCPGPLVVRAYDLAVALRDGGVPTVGGFHTPLEKEMLAFLLRGTQPVVACPARDISAFRPPAAWTEAIAAGRLRLASPFGPGAARIDKDRAEVRNRWVARHAAAVLVVHAAPGGSTDALCRDIAALGKPRFALDDPANANLFALGFVPVAPEGAVAAWQALASGTARPGHE